MNNLATDTRFFWRKLLCTKSNNNPTIQTCGTPARTGAQDEHRPFKTALYNLLLRNL